MRRLIPALRGMGLAGVLAAALVVPAIPAAAAVVVPRLYEAAVPVTGSGEAARQAAFVAALRAVAVRASGRRDAGDRLGAASVANAARLVQRFGNNPDGTLQVGFDRAAIDGVLAQNDLPVWGAERPVTLVWLSIDEPTGQQNWIGADAALPESRLLQQTADLRGLPLAWPVMDAEDRQVATALGNPAQAATRLATLAARYRADAVLVGAARRGSGGEVRVSWTLYFGDLVASATGSVPEGVHLAADQLGALFAASTGPSRALQVEVAAVTDFHAYADMLSYLEGLAAVRSVAVDSVIGDTVRLRLDVRGDAQLLSRAVRLGTRLVPQSGDGVLAADRLALRYQPAIAR